MFCIFIRSVVCVFRFVKQDQVAIARLQTAGVICLETFKEFPQMARFTLRDEGQCRSNELHNCFSLETFFVCCSSDF